MITVTYICFIVHLLLAISNGIWNIVIIYISALVRKGFYKMKTRIRELRTEKNYTQEFLAAKAGINQTFLSRIECGVSMPDAGLLIRLSDIFQVSTDYILCLSDQRLPSLQPANAAQTLQAYQTHISLLQKLNPIQRTHLQHFLESMEAIY